MYKFNVRLLKITVLTMLILPITAAQAMDEDSDIIVNLKKKYYDEYNISEYNDAFIPSDIYAADADMNGDGVKEVALVYRGNCGAAAYSCVWTIYSFINGNYCEIGSLAQESLPSVKSVPRKYKCRTEDNKLDLDEHGNQMTEGDIQRALQEKQPAPDEQQVADTTAATDKPQFKLEMEGVKNSWIWYSITSKMDGLTINKFTVNRNAKNCESYLWANANGVISDVKERTKPAVLNFGETAIYLVSNSCSVIETSVKANNQEWIYEW